MKICSIEGCFKKHSAKGYCQAHYNEQPIVIQRQQEYAKAKKGTDQTRLRRKAQYRDNREEVQKYSKENYLKIRDSIGHRFSSAKNTAKQRKLNWSISLVEYESLRLELCHYCRGALPKYGVGLDRLDNSIGYTIENVVPCCGNCNKLRGERLTPQETLKLIETLYLIRGNESGRLWHK